MKLSKNVRNTLIGVMAAVVATLVAVNPRTVEGTVDANDIYHADTSGTALQWVRYDLAGICHKGVVIMSNYAIVENACAQNGAGHGIRIGKVSSVITNADGTVTYNGTHHVILQNFTATDTVQDGNNYPSGGWGSAIKTEIGAHDILIKDGIVNRCYGEGVAITGGKDVEVSNVQVSNCSKGEFYADNSVNVNFHNNIAICDNPLYKRDGYYPISLFAGTEKYSAMGNRSLLQNLTVTDNVSYGCQPFKYWGGYASPQGLEGGTIINNIFYDPAWTNIYIYLGSLNRDIVITPNQFLKSGTVTPVPSTATKTQTITPTRTATPTYTATKTVTPTYTATSTPTYIVVPIYTDTPLRTLTPTRTPTVTPTATAWCEWALGGTVYVCNKKP